MVLLKNWLFSIFVVLFFWQSISAQVDAQLQFIHNSPDSILKFVDVYINGDLHLDDMEYRDATAFDTMWTNIPLNIGIAPGSSVSAADTVKNYIVTLNFGGTYTAIVYGVLEPANFAPNPDSKSTAFNLLLMANAQKLAQTAGNVEFAFFHGTTDAQTVDVSTRGGAQIMNDVAYSDITTYRSLPANNYIFNVTDASGSILLASFELPLLALADSAAIVFTSGFLNPDMNQNGAGFGLFAAVSTGEVLEFDQWNPTAELQFIHNSPDSILKLADVYINGDLYLDDLEYLDATAFDTMWAEIPLNIGIAPGSSVSAADTVRNYTVTLDSGGTYTAIAFGVLDPAKFALNPNGRSTALNLLVMANAKKLAQTAGNVEFALFHGTTDAPTVDISIKAGAQLVNDAAYGDITTYTSLPANNYVFNVTDASGSIILASFDLPLSALADSAAVFFTTGFMDTELNQNGADFGIYAAVSTGDVLEFDQWFPSAQLQFIHNSPDSGLRFVDVYINNELYLDNLEFRKATAFNTVLAGIPLNISIAPGSSSSATYTLKNYTATLDSGGTYTAIVFGVLEPANFASNPNFISTAFNMLLLGNAQKSAKTGGNVEFAFFHGTTDAQTIDASIRGGAQIVNDAAYGDITNYTSLPANDYIFDATDASGSILLATFDLPLSGLADSAAVVFTSGFMDPAKNQNGAELALLMAMPNGQVSAAGTMVVGVEQQGFIKVTNFDLAQNYPNPFNSATNISFFLPKAEFVTLKIYNVLGQEVASLLGKKLDSGKNTITFDIGNIDTGIYLYQIEAGNYKAIKKMIIIK